MPEMTHAAPGVLVWLEQTALAVWMRQALWAYPAAEIGHIVGIVLLVGPVAMFDLRLLNLSPALSVGDLSLHLLPWAWRGLALVVVTGALMFAAHPTEWWNSSVFPVKMGLIAAAGLNQWLFHRGVFRSNRTWATGVPVPPAAKAAGLASLLFWLSTIACGRLLGYL